MIGVFGATYEAQYAIDGLGLAVTPPVTARRLVAAGLSRARAPAGTPHLRRVSGQAQARGVTAAIFSPDRLSGLVCWFRSDDVALSDGVPVAAWPDRSGQGNYLSQGIAARRPTYRINGVNGLPVVRFVGASFQRLFRDPITLVPQPNTIFAVAKPTAGGVLFGSWDAVNPSYEQIVYDATDPKVRFVANPPNAIVTIDSPLGPWRWYLAIASGAASDFWVDGAQPGRAIEGTFAGGDIGRLFLGAASPSPADDWDGDVAELCIYNRAITSAERGALGAYVKARYGF